MTDDCEFCPDGHEAPERRPWAVYVSPCLDHDGQPVDLIVCKTGGQHVSEADAEWVREVIREAKRRADVPSEPTKPEAMQWNGGKEFGPCFGEGWERVLAWIEQNGGEARYEPMGVGDDFADPCILVRRASGWAPASPGDWIVKGEWFQDATDPMPDGYCGDVRAFSASPEPPR